MNGDEAQRHIDEATKRCFDGGIDNASQADLMFFGFGYLAHIIEVRLPIKPHTPRKKFLIPVSVVCGGVITWLADNITIFF